MPRLTLSLLALGAITLGIALAPPRRAARAEVPLRKEAPPAALGVASCASMACHHGNGDLGTKGSEYSTWIAIDPHARAYNALFNADSLRIQKNLGGGKAHESPLCLQCHGLGAGVPQPLQADGAGCEQCHGNAEKWKATHYLRDFDRSTPGFHDLRKLSPRLRTCMKCHVGDGSREVNHDLIAAGHPRLKFEFAAYYANYPRHWTYREIEERTKRPDQEARLWLMGQAASSRAALELLATRAAGPNWPELSEYDCMACHHDLRGKDVTRRRTDEARARGRRPGDLPWATWYHGLPRALAGEEVRKLLDSLDRDLSKRRPDAEKVIVSARKAARLLAEWEARAEAATFDAATIRRLMAQVADQKALVLESWDGGTQVYLGLAALNAALGDLRSRGLPREALLDLRKQLRGAFPAKSRPLYDTPSGYDGAGLLPLLQRARLSLD